ncbi:MAG: hypothetical protein AAGK09_00980 [Planctomycetota bacterium]
MATPTTQRELDTRYGVYPWALFAFAILWAGVLVALPDDAYVRFQQLGGDFVKARWVYERLHFDPEPVDVVVLGSSRSMDAVDSGLLSDAVSTRDKPVVAANLAVPQYGRNLHRILLHRAIERKHPRLVLIEVNETEDRRGHAMFAELAGPGEMVDQPLAVNFNLLSDAAKFARRRPTGALSTALPGAAGVSRAFDPADYWGTHPPYHRAGDTYPELSADFLDNQSAAYLRGVGERLLPGVIGDVEHRFSVESVRAMASEARAAGADVVFYYLPGYGSADREPAYAALYREWGELWLPPAELFADPASCIDLHHVRHDVRVEYTDWLADRVNGWLNRRTANDAEAGVADREDQVTQEDEAG